MSSCLPACAIAGARDSGGKEARGQSAESSCSDRLCWRCGRCAPASPLCAAGAVDGRGNGGRASCAASRPGSGLAAHTGQCLRITRCEVMQVCNRFSCNASFQLLLVSASFMVPGGSHQATPGAPSRRRSDKGRCRDTRGRAAAGWDRWAGAGACAGEFSTAPSTAPSTGSPGAGACEACRTMVPAKSMRPFAKNVLPYVCKTC